MRIAVLRDTRPGERRVALVPESVAKLGEKDISVAVEEGAGASAGFPDEKYREEGAEVHGNLPDLLADARAVLKVNPPTLGKDGERDEVGALPEGAVFLGFLNPLEELGTVQALGRQGVSALALELLPRVTRAQKMDALSSQATAGGYRAALLGASELGRFLPMLMTAAGTVPPAKVLVLGAGVAGLQAIATCRRLGATVTGFDIRPAVKEQVESLGATFLESDLEADAETEGGYARALSEDEQKKNLDLIAGEIRQTDLVITTAQVPGRRAPVLVTQEMVRSMRAGSVVVDMAASTGGNCQLSEPDQVVEHHGVRIAGPTNLPSELPTHASQMYGRNVSALLLHLLSDGDLRVDLEDEIVSGCCVSHGGRVVHPKVLEALGEAGPEEKAPGGDTDTDQTGEKEESHG